MVVFPIYVKKRSCCRIVHFSASSSFSANPQNAAVEINNNVQANVQNITSRQKNIRLGYQGFRAVHWHQGEADAVLGISTDNYVRLLSNINKQSKIDAGWDIPLDRPEEFRNALRSCAQMDAKSYNQWSECAINLAKQYTDLDTLIKESKTLFNSVIAKKHNLEI